VNPLPPVTRLAVILYSLLPGNGMGVDDTRYLGWCQAQWIGAIRQTWYPLKTWCCRHRPGG